MTEKEYNKTFLKGYKQALKDIGIGVFDMTKKLKKEIIKVDKKLK